MSSEDVEKAMSVDYLNLFINGRAFSDVTFCVEGREIHAHRCILAARSSFFRMIFCSQLDQMDGGGQVIPVGAVGYDVFIIVLQFLYSGRLIIAPNQAVISYKCKERACWHHCCSSAIELALDTLGAAHFFGIDQLSTLVQKQLGGLIDKASIDDLMRVVVAAKKQELPHLWVKCFDLVVKSGLTPATLKKHLPIELVQEIEIMRNKEGGFSGMNRREHVTSGSGPIAIEEQRIRRMQQALDSLDVELVRLMVMGEGLNLDKAHALHYGVTNCSRETVKALLELGAIDVNYPCKGGLTALHLAAQIVHPDMISVLLDHHAVPYLRSHQGATPLDIIRSLSLSNSANSSSSSSSPPCTEVLSTTPKLDQKKLHLCLELLQSAAFVASKDESTESNLSTTGQSGGSVDGSSFAAVDQDLASVYPEFCFPPPCLAFGSSENPLNTIL